MPLGTSSVTSQHLYKMNMYSAIVIAITAAVVLGHEDGSSYDEFKQIAEECKPKVNASDKDMKLVLQHTPPYTRTGQCLIACVLKKAEWMDKDNKINVDVAKYFFEHMKRLEDCKAQEQPEADECVAAYKFFGCMWPKKH